MNCCETTDFIKNQFQFQFQLAALCAVSITRDHSCIGLVGVGLVGLASPGELALVVGAVTSSMFDIVVLVLIVGAALIVGAVTSSMFDIVVLVLIVGAATAGGMSSCLSVVVAGDVV